MSSGLRRFVQRYAPRPRIYPATVEIDNEQTKAMPSTGIVLVAPQGANKVILPVYPFGWVRATQLVAYTNVHASAYFQALVGEYQVFRQIDSDGDDLLTFGSDCVVPLLPRQNQTAGVTDTLEAYENQPLRMFVSNGGSGNLTGGHVGNRLRFSILYTVCDLGNGTFV